MDRKTLVFIFIFAFCVRLVFSTAQLVPTWDEAVYSNLGYDLSKAPLEFSYAHLNWSDFVPSRGDSNYNWPRAGFKAPLLPYFLSLFFLLHISFLVPFVPMVFGAGTVVLVAILGEQLFNKRAGLFAAIFLSLLPVHYSTSSKILTDGFGPFFMVLAMLLFWKGYEEGNVKAKIWFGCVLALSVLARYTTIWLIPTLLIYFIIRDKSLKFVLDGKFWLSVLVFFVTLSPWMIYGVFTYNNPFGFLIHSFIGSTYYAPNYQPWYFYLAESLDMFSIVFVLFLIGLIWIVHTKVYRNREMYFVLLWCLSIVVFTSAMSFKEQRFLLPMVPALCLIAGWSLSQLHYLKKLIIGLVIFGLLASFALHYHKEYIDTHTGTFQCFLEANQFLKNVEKDALVISDESPYVYYYSRHRVAYFPSSRNLSDLDLIVKEISQRQPVYVFYTDWDMTLLKEENARFYDKLEARYPRVFTCAKGKGLAVVYSYKE